jgi:hypothetical protein
VRLYELAYCCHVYVVLGGYDRSLAELRERTGNAVDPGNESHLEPLFIWLRRWGCRQFALADEHIARENVVDWWTSWQRRLPSARRTIDKLDERELDAIGDAFEDLRVRQASWQRMPSRSIAKTFGGTGTAKALFAIRPGVCPPWDEPIRRHFKLASTGDGYRRHLVRIQDELAEATADLEPGATAAQIPAAIGRPEASLAKLVDEHDWVRFTHGTEPPPPELFGRWATWAARAPSKAR